MLKEAQARAALRAFVAVGGIERWAAAQWWEAVPGGWRVRGRLHGWRLRVEPAPGGVRVVVSAPGGEPMAWIVPAGRTRRARQGREGGTAAPR